jgi:predicted RND superfamily exporter protein
MERYLNLHAYHESDDGRVMGMFIRTFKGVTNLGEVRRLYESLEKIAAGVGERHGVWTGVSGSHRNKLNEYALITSDLNRAGSVAAVLIVLLLLASFRSPAVVAVILCPLFAGLLWAFSLVPATVGDLNLITAFLLVIMFGMGVDYSIHLVKRYRQELVKRSDDDALYETYLSTGASVIVSGLTTALSLSVLAVSDFRGFSEFGIVGALSIVMMLLAMFLTLPSTLVLARRFSLLKPAGESGFRGLMPRRWATVLLALLVAAAAVAAAGLSFDYNFRNLQFDKSRIKGLEEVKARQRQVYSASISPGAIFLADSVAAVEELSGRLESFRGKEGSIIGRVRSARSYAPGAEELEERKELLADIQDTLRGRWTRKIEDPDRRQLVDDFREWEIPEGGPGIDDLPESLRRAYEAKDGSGRHIVTVHPAADRKDGRNAMKFAAELREAGVPDGAVGPIGETVVFAEIIWIVTAEGLWLTLLTFGGVLVIVFLYRRSVRETLWICLPLAGGVLLALGALTAAGLRLNFFNVVVIPALLGMGVDGGVHYYRRWRELGESIEETQRELFDPLSIANWTTMIGYSGMIFANHPGIRSIGVFATIGLACIWLTTLFLLPGLLSLFGKSAPAR